MKRGDLATAAFPADLGKPRPVLDCPVGSIQQHRNRDRALSVSAIVDAPLLRVTVDPTSTNGLRKTSQIMVDKAMSIRRGRVGKSFGRLDDDAMIAINRSLAVFLGFA